MESSNPLSKHLQFEDTMCSTKSSDDSKLSTEDTSFESTVNTSNVDLDITESSNTKLLEYVVNDNNSSVGSVFGVKLEVNESLPLPETVKTSSCIKYYSDGELVESSGIQSAEDLMIDNNPKCDPTPCLESVKGVNPESQETDKAYSVNKFDSDMDLVESSSSCDAVFDVKPVPSTSAPLPGATNTSYYNYNYNPKFDFASVPDTNAQSTERVQADYNPQCNPIFDLRHVLNSSKNDILSEESVLRQRLIKRSKRKLIQKYREMNAVPTEDDRFKYMYHLPSCDYYYSSSKRYRYTNTVPGEGRYYEHTHPYAKDQHYDTTKKYRYTSAVPNEHKSSNYMYPYAKRRHRYAVPIEEHGFEYSYPLHKRRGSIKTRMRKFQRHRSLQRKIQEAKHKKRNYDNEEPIKYEKQNDLEIDAITVFLKKMRHESDLRKAQFVNSP